MAGLYETYKDPKYGAIKTFTILTTDAVPPVAEIHDRMPVILGSDRVEEWILSATPEAEIDKLNMFLDSLEPPPLAARPVSKRVNRPGVDDDPTLLDEVVHTTQQGSLF